jgi:hypothetical protein
MTRRCGPIDCSTASRASSWRNETVRPSPCNMPAARHASTCTTSSGTIASSSQSSTCGGTTATASSTPCASGPCEGVAGAPQDARALGARAAEGAHERDHGRDRDRSDDSHCFSSWSQGRGDAGDRGATSLTPAPGALFGRASTRLRQRSARRWLPYRKAYLSRSRADTYLSPGRGTSRGYPAACAERAPRASSHDTSSDRRSSLQVGDPAFSWLRRATSSGVDSS